MDAKTAAKLKSARERCKKNLAEAILPFWYPRTIDTQHGGYSLNHDYSGNYLGAADKMLVTQARCLWFYAYLYNHGFAKPEYLQAAAHGYDYLRRTMWDDTHGGFFWTADPAGQPLREEKHLYGQGFGLYALCEYYKASKNEKVLTLANKLFSLLETKAHDGRYGGYLESFRRDWSQPPADSLGALHVPPALKLMNTHLHLMEPFTTYYQVTEDPIARERLIELIHIQGNAVVRKTLGACTDKYTRAWEPLLQPPYAVVSYGHDIENIWLLMLACDTAGINNGPFGDLYRTLFDYSYKYGFDKAQGGWYNTGPFKQPADDRRKIWWVQAEGLVASLELFLRMKDERYLSCFEKTLDWIDTQQTDWQHGDWHGNAPESEPQDAKKASPWKGPYHNGRAMARCIERIGGVV